MRSLSCPHRQVLPELRAKGRAAEMRTAAKKRAASLAWAKKLQSLLHRHHITSASQTVRKAANSDRAARQGGRDFLKALDHQLQAITGGLAAFRPRLGAASRPLARGEVRYVAADARLAPPDVPSDVKRRRICIRNVDAGACRVEVSDFKLERPLMPIWTDEGPRDMPALWFLAGQGCRMLFFFDPLHGISRDLSLAAKGAGLWASILDTTICLTQLGPEPLQVAGVVVSRQGGRRRLLRRRVRTRRALRFVLRGDLPGPGRAHCGGRDGRALPGDAQKLAVRLRLREGRFRCAVDHMGVLAFPDEVVLAPVA